MPNTGLFRHAAGFGKRIEYSIIAEMLKEGMDVYVPLVDENGIDAVVAEAEWELCRSADQGTVGGGQSG